MSSSRDNAVGIATGFGLDGVKSPGKVKIFLFSTSWSLLTNGYRGMFTRE
jgi:hypothetical protein